MGLALGFDAINRERSQGTLTRLISQPIHRDAVISAKFLAGAVAILMLMFFEGVLVGGVGLLVIGVPPTGEEILRLVSYLLLTSFYTMLWLGLAMLFSVLCKHAATSALIVIALWIYFTVFASMISSVIANLCYPLDGIQGYYNTLSNYELQLGPIRYIYSPRRRPRCSTPMCASSASPPRTRWPERCRERSPLGRARCWCGRTLCAWWRWRCWRSPFPTSSSCGRKCARKQRRQSRNCQRHAPLAVFSRAPLTRRLPP